MLLHRCAARRRCIDGGRRLGRRHACGLFVARRGWLDRCRTHGLLCLWRDVCRFRWSLLLIFRRSRRTRRAGLLRNVADRSLPCRLGSLHGGCPVGLFVVLLRGDLWRLNGRIVLPWILLRASSARCVRCAYGGRRLPRIAHNRLGRGRGNRRSGRSNPNRLGLGRANRERATRRLIFAWNLCGGCEGRGRRRRSRGLNGRCRHGRLNRGGRSRRGGLCRLVSRRRSFRAARSIRLCFCAR